MKYITEPGQLDMNHTMYPSSAALVRDACFTATKWSTVYGVVLQGRVLHRGREIRLAEYFCVAAGEEEEFKVEGTAVFFTRLGFQGQTQIGGPVERTGRLCYIDGCSDSILVSPPRCGDPSLNFLHFPAGIEQSFHIHPSIRLGVVLRGGGICSLADKEIPLVTGTVFCLDERERHRFRTTAGEMTVVAYHPDGDWGPTDRDHPMKNRTLIT